MLIYALLLACSGDDPGTPEPTDVSDTDTDTDTDSDTDSDTDADTDSDTDTDTAVEIVGSAPLEFLGARPTNVLMISIDTFRKDHLTRYGGQGETDWMDGIMADGVVMDDYLTCSNWTFPGLSCTVLGRYHEDNGHLPQMSVMNRAPFPDNSPFVAEAFRDAGFDTAVSSRNGWFSEEWNALQGYDTILPGVFGADAQLQRGLEHLTADDGPQANGQPWFLHVHVTEPHVSYDPPESYLGELEDLEPIDFDLTVSSQHYDARDSWPVLGPSEQELVLQHMQIRYRAEIAWLDDLLEAKMAEYDAAGLLDDTLVVFWNDHGEQFWEHGSLTHAYDLYRQENDGFLFFWSKNIVPSEWSHPTHAVDVVPTVLDVAQVLDLHERSGEVIGTVTDPDRVRFGQAIARNGAVFSVTRGSDRFMYFGRAGRYERYDLAADPGETNDLYRQDPALDAELLDLLQPRIDKAKTIAPHLILTDPNE